MEYLSALACIGLASDTSTVSLRDLDPFLGAEQDGKGDGAGQKLPANPEWRDCVAQYLGERMSALQQLPNEMQEAALRCNVTENRKTPWRTRAKKDKAPPGPYMDVRLAATWGARMGLVQESGTTDPDASSMVHFQHSIIQAYLGSRFLPAILALPAPAAKAAAAHQRQGLSSEPDRLSAHPKTLRDQCASRPEKILSVALPSSGRELVIAFLLFSRAGPGFQVRRKPATNSAVEPRGPGILDQAG